MEDPTEEELAGAAKKVETMVAQLQHTSDFFFTPASFGALPELWLQARLTIELKPFQDKLARILYAIAVKLWLRGRAAAIQSTINGVARGMTLRLAEPVNVSPLTPNACSMLRTG